MNAKGKSIRGGFLTLFLFVLAAGLLLFSAVGSSRAALTYYSETYSAQVEMTQIGVSLMENDTTRDNNFHMASNRDYSGANDIWMGNHEGALVQNLTTQTDNALVLDHEYREELYVANSGSIDEFVRVSIYRYWEDANGKKLVNLSPSLIDLNILTGNGWIEDTGARTTERNVLYYQMPVLSGGSTPLFADHLTIHNATDELEQGMQAKVTLREFQDENGNTVYETVYDYEGVHFVLRVDVDAVQTHNAQAAIKSAWGVEMSDFGIHD